MARLEIGRTPVREALRQLARENLVEVHARRGMFVSSVEVGDLAALSEVRARLESFAAGLAAERRTARGPRRDGPRCSRSSKRSLGDGRALIDLDQRLHRHVYRCAHNPFLEATLDGYYVLTLRIWFMALDRVARLDDAVHEHRALLEAIRDGDATERRGRNAASHRRLRAGDPGGALTLSRRAATVIIGGPVGWDDRDR